MPKSPRQLLLSALLLTLALCGLAAGVLFQRVPNRSNSVECDACAARAELPKNVPSSETSSGGDSDQRKAAVSLRTADVRLVDFHSQEGVGQLPVEIRLTGGVADGVQSMVSDREGRILFPVADCGGANIKLAPCGYRFVQELKDQVAVWWGEGSIDPITLFVEPFGRFTIQFLYADRVFYAGEVEVLFGYERSQKFTTDEQGAITFDCKLGGVATVIVESKRPAFNGTRAKVSLETVAQVPVEIVLPDGDARTGTLEIDLGLFPADSDYDIVVKLSTQPDYPLQNRPTYLGRGAKGGVVHISKPLPAGEYFVRVHSRQIRADAAGLPTCIITQTAPIQIEAGQSKRVTPVPRSSYSVRVRIVDEKGAPISPAVLGINSEAYRRWPIDDYKPGQTSALPVFGYADADGIAIAAGICVEVRVLSVEAPGYELQDIEVSPSEGAVVDAGNVVLKKAQGAIEIQLEGEGTGKLAEYEIQLLQPLGQVVYGPTAFTGTTFKIEGLPLRRYTISIKDLSGRTAAYSQNVDLDAASPLRTVKLVMRKWPFEENEK
jgi:hypothetical protein